MVVGKKAVSRGGVVSDWPRHRMTCFKWGGDVTASNKRARRGSSVC